MRIWDLASCQYGAVFHHPFCSRVTRPPISISVRCMLNFSAKFIGASLILCLC